MVELTQEYQHGAHPLHGADGVGKEDHGSQDGEELPCCGDDGACQGTKIHNCHEDKALERERCVRPLSIAIGVTYDRHQG